MGKIKNILLGGLIIVGLCVGASIPAINTNATGEYTLTFSVNSQPQEHSYAMSSDGTHLLVSVDGGDSQYVELRTNPEDNNTRIGTTSCNAGAGYTHF